MRNSKKGFIVPLLITIVVVLVVGGGIYAYKKDKTVLLNGTNSNNSQPNQIEQTSSPITPSIAQSTGLSPSSIVEVPGMQQYNDPEFGFSFWYPKNWSIKQGAPNTNVANLYTGGTILKTITVGSSQAPNEGIAIEKFVSTGNSITDNSNCGPVDGCGKSLTYYFDSTIHTWLAQTNNFDNSLSTVAANVSNNSMGGLHILHGNARFGDNVIIPLSAKKFVVVHNLSAGTNRVGVLAKTIMAHDPSVATPVSKEEQIKTINTEGLLYGVLGTSVGSWYVDSQHIYDRFGNIIVGARPSTFRVIKTYSDGFTTDATAFATDGIRIYSSWSDSHPILEGADPETFIPIRQQYQIPYAQNSGKYGQSFASEDTTFSKDKSHVWYKDFLIPGADPKTFVVTGNTHVQNSNGGYTLAHDSNHVYGIDAKDSMTIDGRSL